MNFLRYLLIFGLSLNTAYGQTDSTGVILLTDSTVVLPTDPELVEVEASSATPLSKDSLDWRQRHSSKRATILSAVVPSAGQIYNRKYWKAPIVWAGMGVSVYFIQRNTRQLRRYKDAYIAIVDDDPNTIDEFNGSVSADRILSVVDTYRKWRDLSYIAVGAVYVLNIIDANVDAHFVRFDVGPDLTLEMGPSLPAMAQGAVGLNFALVLR